MTRQDKIDRVKAVLDSEESILRSEGHENAAKALREYLHEAGPDSWVRLFTGIADGATLEPLPETVVYKGYRIVCKRDDTGRIRHTVWSPSNVCQHTGYSMASAMERIDRHARRPVFKTRELDV